MKENNEQVVEVKDGVDKVTINLEKKFMSRSLLLCDVLPKIKGRMQLKVVEYNNKTKERREWKLAMSNGENMLSFLRNDTHLVDGPLLLNCDVADIISLGQRKWSEGNATLEDGPRTEVIVEMFSE